MFSRCPDCATTFRVTPEQLKARSGKVRCGHCQTVFNAIDELLVDEVPLRDAAGAEMQQPGLPESAPVPSHATPAEELIDLKDLKTVDIELDPSPPAADTPEETNSVPGKAEVVPPSPEAVLQTAQKAGLVAARDTRGVRGYSKWAEKPLAGSDTSFETPSRPRWPFVLASLLCVAALAAQAAYHFRSEIAARWPETRPSLVAACQAIGCEVPLPRQAELIGIEGSELQVDAARGGLLMLQATLKNRAATPQQLPSLELTLTDAQDRAVIRRVLAPADYLPPRASTHTAFAAGGEITAKLWIDARDTGAAGYRLYVFYP